MFVRGGVLWLQTHLSEHPPVGKRVSYATTTIKGSIPCKVKKIIIYFTLQMLMAAQIEGERGKCCAKSDKLNKEGLTII